jgi:hypothetical protein
MTSDSAAAGAVRFERPDTAEAAGRRLAAELTGLNVDVVLVGEDVRDLVLGHVVARELGAALVYVFDDGGLLQASTLIAAGSAVTFVGVSVAESFPVRAALSLLDRHGADLRAVATVEAHEHPDLPLAPARLISLSSADRA